jgi:predicted nucleic acid-binding protein
LVIELEQPIKLKTAELRKAYRIKLPDAIIAATSIVYDLTLLSHNVVDFHKIAHLNLIDPWKIKKE